MLLESSDNQSAHIQLQNLQFIKPDQHGTGRLMLKVDGQGSGQVFFEGTVLFKDLEGKLRQEPIRILKRNVEYIVLWKREAIPFKSGRITLEL